MNSRHFFPFLAAMSLIVCGEAPADASLHGPNRISSTALGYDLQYWVYLPKRAEKPLPELYVTDGYAYLEAGGIVDVLEREFDAGRTLPFAVILVDNRDPDFPEKTRRNEEFMCNAHYGRFYLRELMPEVAGLWTGADAATARGMMGVSFGGINGACFAMMLPGVFRLVIMNSPASDEHLEVESALYRERPVNPSGFLVTYGGPRDNRAAAKRFVRVLERKGYDVQVVETDGEHDWRQWRPLLDDGLSAFAKQLGARADSKAGQADAPDE